MPQVLVNQRTNTVIATCVEVANTRETRNRGLLGRASMGAGEALLLVPCWTIHTAFMRFAIDVVFINGKGRVVKIVRNIRPWRAAGSIRGRAVVEMAAGGLTHDLHVGDVVSLVETGTSASAA